MKLEHAIRAILVAIGVVTALPALALVSPEQTLQVSYGVRAADPTTLVLLQHRGIFQLLLGAGIVIAAFRPVWRIPVAVAAAVSKGAFVAMMLSNPVTRAAWPTWVAVFDVSSVIVLGLVAASTCRHRQGDVAVAMTDTRTADLPSSPRISS